MLIPSYLGIDSKVFGLVFIPRSILFLFCLFFSILLSILCCIRSIPLLKPNSWWYLPCLKQRNNHRPAESYVDQSRGVNSASAPALVFAGKFDEKNICVSPTIAGSAQNPVESDISTATTFKQMDNHPMITNKGIPFPMSLQPNVFTPVRISGAVPQLPPKLASDAENISSHPQPQLCQLRSCPTDGGTTSDKPKEQDLTVEGGTISISSVYSQG